MSAEVNINNLIKDLKGIKPQVSSALPKIAETVRGSIQDRVITQGIDSKGKKMKYAKSTKRQKLKDGRTSGHVTLTNKHNRVWSQHRSFKSGKDQYTVGWGSGEGGKLAAYISEKRDFHGIGKKEEKAIDRVIGDLVKGLKI